MSTPASDPIDEILRRIARVESEGLGGYAARGPVVQSGDYRGQRAAGKYQIMPGNIPAWSREALGREVSLSEFLANPELQERIARHRVSAIYRQHPNVADVASVWHSGRPLSQAGNARDQNMTTQEYVGHVTGTPQEGGVDLERLERALRNAHAAGDEPAARRLAAEIIRLRQQSPVGEGELSGARLDPLALQANLSLPGDTGQPDAGAQGSAFGDEAYVQLQAPYDPNQQGEAPLAADSAFAPIRAKMERGEPLTDEEARVLGYASAREAEADGAPSASGGSFFTNPFSAEGAANRANVMGLGDTARMMVHGASFGLSPILEGVGAAVVPGGQGYSEARDEGRAEVARIREENPVGAIASEVAGGIIAGGPVARGSGAALRLASPRAAAAASSVFALQSGQTARNLARLAVTGAAAGAAAGLGEQGTEGVLPGATAGAVAGPVLVGGASALGAGAGAVISRFRPDNAALRLLAKRMGEPVSALEQRYAEFVQLRGRAPRLVEIMRRETAEEMGQVARARSEAGGVFRDAEEAAARALPAEMAPLVRGGGPITSEPAAAARRGATTEAAADVVGRRVQSTVVRQVGVKGTRDGGQRGRSMDTLMERIGEHRVPVTPEMMEVVENPDLMGALEPAVRRGLRRTLEAAGEGETPYLSVRDWDTLRRELGRRAKTENGGRYTQLRNEVRDYVSVAVPEYGAGLREYGRRTDTARGTAAGQRILTRSTREFSDQLRSVTTPEMAGARVGARTALANALNGDPAKAEQLMERLARDPAMRERVRLALRGDESAQLERLAERYGYQLDFSTGLRTGRGVVKQNDTDAFRASVNEAGSALPGEFGPATAGQTSARAGVRQGARAALSEAAGESPAGAARTAMRMAEDPGLQERIAFALGDAEQRRLTAVGQSVVESSRRLAEAAPGGTTQAQTRARENAEGVQRVIQASVIASGRWSGAFLGNFTNSIVQRSRLSKRAARRLAEMATDPARAEQMIRRLRSTGVGAEEILLMYQNAAAAAGLVAGQEVQ